VSSWRNLRDVDLQIDPGTPLVCLVGENGSGKSAMLELLSAAAHHLGISQGLEIPRGNPFDEDHDFRVVVEVPTASVQLPEHAMTQLATLGESWSGQLVLTSRRENGQLYGPVIVASGLSSPYDRQFAQEVVNALRQRQETQHLYLDADRSYPPVQIEPHRYGEILQQQWGDPAFTRQWAHRPTRTLYEEWMKYFLGVEEHCAADYVASIRRAREAGEPEPSFVDPFDGYATTLREVLPHLQFVGVESSGSRRMPRFDSAGLELSFSKLSGGEREIAFLIGQIDRFQLRRGLLLIDEPELHLNPDLLRNWLAFLRDTVSEGQAWVATHSLEAVEVAGPASTFVFERDPQSRTVTAPARLAGRPVLSALAAAVGSPAFAISRLRFVYVEGDRQSRERERFYAVCGESNDNRFLEGGNCREVIRRLKDVTALAAETDEQLHVGGVIDRDFRSDSECSALQSDVSIHVLGCHEIENLYLQPEAVTVLLTRAKRTDDAINVVRECADSFAGLWIVQNASTEFAASHEVPKGALSPLSAESWPSLQTNWTSFRQASGSNVDAAHRAEWETLLDQALAGFAADRVTNDWYRRCLGKQTLSRLAANLGFKSPEPLERNVVALWENGEVARPGDLDALRKYVTGLSN
jgi:hypothetical protein